MQISEFEMQISIFKNRYIFKIQIFKYIWLSEIFEFQLQVSAFELQVPVFKYR